MKILFVCKANRFRSKVVEAICQKLGGWNVKVRRAGVRLDIIRLYVAKGVMYVLGRKIIRF